MKKKIIILLASLLILSCSSRYASNGENQYMQSRNGVNLIIPPPLSSSTISHFYDLPQQSQTANVDIRPPNMLK